MTHGRRHVCFPYLGCLDCRPLVPLAFELYMAHITWVQVYDFWNFFVKFVSKVEGEQTPNHPLKILDQFFLVCLLFHAVSCLFEMVLQNADGLVECF